MVSSTTCFWLSESVSPSCGVPFKARERGEVEVSPAKGFVDLPYSRCWSASQSCGRWHARGLATSMVYYIRRASPS